jgi:hypothetical protein
MAGSRGAEFMTSRSEDNSTIEASQLVMNREGVSERACQRGRVTQWTERACHKMNREGVSHNEYEDVSHRPLILLNKRHIRIYFHMHIDIWKYMRTPEYKYGGISLPYTERLGTAEALVLHHIYQRSVYVEQYISLMPLLTSVVIPIKLQRRI